MFSGTVDTGKRLFMEQTDQTIAFSHLPEYFHNQHVMVNGQILFFKHGRQFKLGRSYLVMPCPGGDAEFPEFPFHFAHEVEDTGTDGPEIMIFKLLVLRRRSAEKGTAGLHQIRTLEVKIPVNEKILLFSPQRKLNCAVFFAEAAHETLDRTPQRLNGTQKRGLAVKCGTGVGAERRRNTKCCALSMTFDECGTGGIPGRISPGLKGAAQTAGRET